MAIENPNSPVSMHKLTVFVVDGAPATMEMTVQALLKNGYKALRCSAGLEAAESIRKMRPDIVLVSMKMPPIVGKEVHKQIAESFPTLPMIVLCSAADIPAAMRLVKEGAFDFAQTNPFDESYLVRVVSRAAETVRVRQIEQRYGELVDAEVQRRMGDCREEMAQGKLSSLEVVRRLLTAAEFRDDETGNHVKRIGMYATVISATLGMDRAFKETIAIASSMHDIGKIGIPDNVLQKPGALSAAEYETMKKHTAIGYQILAGSPNPYIIMAAGIALGHHERWTGTGYPKGLRGEAIPIESRITIVCDQYDALRSQRPYKPALDHHAAMKIITDGDGRTIPEHFEARVIDAFVKVAPICEKIFDTNITA
jgi:putative two-component system response regulator